MNRLSMTVSDRRSFKRTGVLAIILLFAASIFMMFTPYKASAAACTAPTTDFGSATATLKVDNAATYRIWSRIMSPDTPSNSYLLEVDGNTCYVVGDGTMTPSAWTWVDYQNGTASSKVQQNFTVGNHSIKMIGREAGVKLGRIMLVSDLNCVPTGNGDNCAVVGDTVLPSVNVTAPAENATVANTVQITADATDNVAVTKVEFYVNGTLKQTDGQTRTYNWDTKTATNGAASIMVKAYDAAGNSNSDSIQVTIANGDSQAPTVPGSVTATADSATKVTVKWSASTDNTAVTGYWVLRGGQTLSKVTAGTQYVDSTALPGIVYKYQVSAFDAAGNTSALSNAASVTTPTPPTADTQAPSVPAGLQAQVVNEKQINLAWTASTDNVAVSAYDVYRSVGQGSAVKVATVTTTSYGDSGLAASTAYKYSVAARDAANNVSAQSQSVTATTATKPPTVTKGAIKGRVTFAKNSDRHAHVTITVLGVKRVYDTDSLGNYRIDNVPVGTYRIKYEAQGSYSKYVTVKVSAGKIANQDVTLRRR